MRPDDEKKDGRLPGAMRIFEALSAADEELLERSEKAAKVVPFRKYAKVMAACACLVLLGTAVFVGNRMFSAKSDNSASDVSDGAAPESGAAQAALTAQSQSDFDEQDMGEAASEDTTAAMDAVEEAAAGDMAEDALTGETAEKSVSEERKQGNSAESITDYDAAQQGLTVCPECEEEDGLMVDGETAVGSDFNQQWETLEEEVIRATEELGAYLPTKLPAGYVYEGGYKAGEEDAPESISAFWTNGMDEIMLVVTRYDAAEEQQCLEYPIFKESDFSLDIVKQCMKSVTDQGDTGTPRGAFAVLYDSGILVEFTGNGDAESIWEMFQSITP